MAAEAIELVARGIVKEPAEVDSGPLHFEAIRVVLAADIPRAAHMANWQAFQGVVVALVFVTGTKQEMLGSAVMVGPGVALGADHTVREWIPKLNGGETALYAVGVTTDGLVMWSVKHGVCIEGTDMSLMRLKLETKLPPARRLYMATMSTRLPAIGERLSTAGFVATAELFEQRLAETMELQGGLRLTCGPVLRHFPEKRDNVLAKYPCLEIDAPLYGGMSGGPVFDARGFLVALNSRSPNLGPDEEPSPMIAGLIWPGLGQRFPAVTTRRGP